MPARYALSGTPCPHDFMPEIGKSSKEGIAMGQVQGHATIMKYYAGALSSPAMAQASARIAALVWAFQQQGWAACIPYLMFFAVKIRDLRWKALATRVIRAVCAGARRCDGAVAGVTPERAAIAPAPAGRRGRAQASARQCKPIHSQRWPRQSKRPAACTMRRGVGRSERA